MVETGAYNSPWGEPMGKNGEKWGKNFYGESILGLTIFPIFPH